MQSLDIIVKQQCGAYVTNTYAGQRTSCTVSAEMAAQNQGIKLFGEHFARAQKLHDISVGTEAWRLFANTEQG